MQDSVRVWMDSLTNRAEGTRRIYRKHFERFVAYIQKTPDELRGLKWQENQSAKPWERSHVENLVRDYLASMEQDEGLSCSYAQGAYASIRSFFTKNGMPLFMDGNDRPEGEGIGSLVPTKEQVKQLVHGAGTLRYRALILFLKDSGLRISDALGLKWGDLHNHDGGFYGFELITKKRHAKANGFVGSETTNALNLYKQKRLKGTRKIAPERNLEEHYIFCARAQPTKALAVTAVSKNIGDIIRRIGFEGLKPHGLRKFWEQHMKAEREAYLKQINGRKLTTVEHAYLTKNPADLFEIYRENYDNLRVLADPMIRQIPEEEIEAIVEKRVAMRVAALQNELGELRRVLDNPLMVKWLEEKLAELEQEQE